MSINQLLLAMVDANTIVSSLREDIFKLMKSRHHKQQMLVPNISPIQSVLQCNGISFDNFSTGFIVHEFSNEEHTKYARRVKTSLNSSRYYERTEMKIWFNDTMPPDDKNKQIEITEHITSRNESNGIPDSSIAVFKGRMGTVNLAIKFREVTPTHQDLAEKEANHAVKTHKNDSIKPLFPTLYFIMNLTFKPADGFPPVVWDVIGTELLSPIGDLIQQDTFYHQCFLLLKELHSHGFIHGDAHRGNFMVRADQRFDENNPKVCMIDQDMIEELPDDNKALRNYLQILDYQELLYHSNPHCCRFHDNEKVKISIDEKSTDLCDGQERLGIIFLPFGYLQHRTATILQVELPKYHATEPRRAAIAKQLRTYVHKNSRTTFYQYLNTIDTAYIDNKFEMFFMKTQSMRSLQTSIRMELQKLYTTQSIQPMVSNETIMAHNYKKRMVLDLRFVKDPDDMHTVTANLRKIRAHLGRQHATLHYDKKDPANASFPICAVLSVHQPHKCFCSQEELDLFCAQSQHPSKHTIIIETVRLEATGMTLVPRTEDQAARKGIKIEF